MLLLQHYITTTIGNIIYKYKIQRSGKEGGFGSDGKNPERID
ncbi:hypothetical protein [Mucilaginibacter rubeus]|nr:hypothetical protein [Mucilaginibacter rubeus]